MASGKKFWNKMKSSYKGKQKDEAGEVDDELDESDDEENGIFSTKGQDGIMTLAEPEDAEIDVAFVHGLTGGRETTWTHKKSGTFWPKDLLPTVFPRARIITLGYDVNVVGLLKTAGSGTLRGHGRALVNDLGTRRSETGSAKRPIIFVAHSLGGLVIEQALLISLGAPEEHLHEILDSTYGIIFMGTPHAGAPKADVAGAVTRLSHLVLATNKKVVDVLKPGSEVLAGVQQEFHTMLRARQKNEGKSLEILCFYEERPVKGIGKIVPDESAILPGYNHVVIPGTHMSMTKFSGDQKAGYVRVRSNLKIMVKNAVDQHAARPDARVPSTDRPPSNDDGGGGGLTRPVLPSNTQSAGHNYSGTPNVGTGSSTQHNNTKQHSGIINNVASITGNPIFNQGFNEHPETPSPPSSTVPFRADVDFVDRGTSDDDRTLLQRIEQQHRSTASRVALVGIGGAGKSQLGIEYCHRLRKRSKQMWVFWIHASNINRIEQGYREIAELLKIPGRKNLQEDIFELVARWLRDESKGEWMLVLDNLDDETILSPPRDSVSKAQSGIKNDRLRRPFSAYLPQSQNGVILITTRTTSVAEKLVEPREIIRVDPMTERDATELLKKKLDLPYIDDGLRELASILEYMPLAIVQAAAYIYEKGARCSVQQYIKTFQQNDILKTSRLEYEAGHLRRDPEAKNSIIATWQISFDDIRKYWSSSADLLSLMCYFDRQGIPQEALKIQSQHKEMQEANNVKVREKGEDENVEDNGSSETSIDNSFEEAVDPLLRYSFVSRGKDNRSFEMHGLVQLATRRWLTINEEDEKWKAQFTRNLNAILPTGDYKYWGQCEKLFPHVKSAERHRPTNDRSEWEWAEMLGKAAWYVMARGDYHEAERMCEKSVKALKKIFGGEDLRTSASLVILTSTYQNQGRWKEAEELQLQVVGTVKRLLGQEHLDTLAVIGNLTSIYQDQGRWKEAEELQLQVLETRKRMLRQKHPDTLIDMANLALTYQNQGRWKEAEELQLQVLEMRKRVLEQEHPHTLIDMANLALTYQNQGRWKEAEELQLQVLETRKRMLGQEHPHTLIGMANLALTYQKQGRWKEAEELQLQMLETSKRVLGQEHLDTLTAIGNLASTYQNQGRWKEAEELQLQVIEMRKRVLGQEHLDTLNVMINLAWTYHNQGRWKEAEELQLQVLETSKRVLGQEHPGTLIDMGNLAFTLKAQGRKEEAIELMAECIRLRIQVLGAEHPRTLSSTAVLAEWQSLE